MPGTMVYSIEERGGRFIVISPKGKKWKTTYASRGAAEKGVAYVEGRFGGSGSSAREAAPAQADESPEDERKRLGIPPRVGDEEDTEGW